MNVCQKGTPSKKSINKGYQKKVYVKEEDSKEISANYILYLVSFEYLEM